LECEKKREEAEHGAVGMLLEKVFEWRRIAVYIVENVVPEEGHKLNERIRGKCSIPSECRSRRIGNERRTESTLIRPLHESDRPGKEDCNAL